MKAKTRDAILRAGTVLSNIAHNWAQCPGKLLTQTECRSLNEWQVAWDAAVSQYRSDIAAAKRPKTKGRK